MKFYLPPAKHAVEPKGNLSPFRHVSTFVPKYRGHEACHLYRSNSISFSVDQRKFQVSLASMDLAPFANVSHLFDTGKYVCMMKKHISYNTLFNISRIWREGINWRLKNMPIRFVLHHYDNITCANEGVSIHHQLHSLFDETTYDIKRKRTKVIDPSESY